MSRFVLQNWTPTAKLRANWAAEEPRLRNALGGIHGLSVLALEPGQGIVEITGRGNAVRDMKRRLEAVLPGWKVYDETSYSLPELP